jgi:thiamine-phosphate pyrophosphorylase
MSDSLSRRKLARAATRLADTAPYPRELPPLILMTDDNRLSDPLRATAALPRGSLVIVRARDTEHRKRLAAAVMVIAHRRGLRVLIAADPALALACGADGVHLPEACMGNAAHLRARYHVIITAAAHSLAALRKARWVDAVVLSPVFPTASHPGRPSLSPLRAGLIARLSPVPVYALGGVSAWNAGRLSGFAGIAGIGALATQ